MTRTLQVLRPGALTTVQDTGRVGSRHLGVGCAGALDAYSAHVANLLVGNPADAALLEISLSGPTLRTNAALRVAITGADIDAQLDGVPLPGWRPIEVPAGSELRFGACRRGARAYLAIAGGIVLPRVLGSVSTDLRAAFGGWQGRALRSGDVLSLGASAKPLAVREVRVARWWVDAQPDLDFSRDVVAHLLPGRDATTPANAICAQPWRVAAASDRQGVRLEGAPLVLADPRDRISEPVAPGTVQLPPDGRPIVLLADAQTVGGYPRIGHVASADLPRLAQCRPGDVVHFSLVDAAGAQTLWREQRQRLARIELAVTARGR